MFNAHTHSKALCLELAALGEQHFIYVTGGMTGGKYDFSGTETASVCTFHDEASLIGALE